MDKEKSSLVHSFPPEVYSKLPCVLNIYKLPSHVLVHVLFGDYCHIVNGSQKISVKYRKHISHNWNSTSLENSEFSDSSFSVNLSLFLWLDLAVFYQHSFRVKFVVHCISRMKWVREYRWHLAVLNFSVLSGKGNMIITEHDHHHYNFH